MWTVRQWFVRTAHSAELRLRPTGRLIYVLSASTLTAGIASAVLQCPSELSVSASAIQDELCCFRRTLFEFDSREGFESQQWRSVDDVVMGGVSRSQVEFCDKEKQGFLRFSGEVKRVPFLFKGGFSSAKVSEPLKIKPDELSRYEGCGVIVRGDGKIYKLRIERLDLNLDGVHWQASFKAPEGSWAPILINWDSFVPVRRGKEQDIPKSRLFDAASKAKDGYGEYRLGILVSDNQIGPFTLELQKMFTYSNPEIDGECKSGPASI